MEVESTGKEFIPNACILIAGVKYSRVGNTHIFFRKGKILYTVGPHWPGVLFTSALIILAAYLNIFLIRATETDFRLLLIFFVCILCIFAELFLYSCALLDPGILLPKRIQGELIEENASLFTENGSYYCSVCEINQPIGTAHCSFCDVCIDKLDHHCPWMGKCIGRRNMIWFKCLIGVVVLYMTELLIVAFILS